jgi:hypothetical protein
MAINAPVLQLILKLAAQAPGPKRMLCLGYPDMLVTDAQLASLCGPEILKSIAWRDDSDKILGWHGLRQSMARVPETKGAFARMGIECDFVDIVASRGFEIVVDLNQPAPAEMLGQYDIVYDGGTMEHCFNVGQVMRNIFGFAKTGGLIVHVNPINYYNHGFFNFNPTFYYDWYVRSGNAMASPFYAMHGPITETQLLVLEPTRKFQVPERSVMLVAAHKRQAAMPEWPMQSKYVRHAGLKPPQ